MISRDNPLEKERLMPGRLQSRRTDPVARVTDGSSGIGRAVPTALACNEARVTVLVDDGVVA